MESIKWSDKLVRAHGVNDAERYQFNFSTYLEGETISTHDVTTDSGTISGVAESAGVVSFVLSGLTLGTTAFVSCSITTSGGRDCTRSVRFKPENL